MKNRLVSTIILAPITIVVLFMFSLIQLTCFLLLLNILSILEWNKLIIMSKIKKYICFAIFHVIPIILIILITFRTPKKIFYQYIQYVFICITLTWWLGAFFLLLFYPKSAKIWKKSTTLQTLFGNLIIIPLFWSILILQQENYFVLHNNSIGTWKTLYVIILTWGLDSSYYLIGKTLGKHKMSKTISPKKTWEGLIGGIIISSIIHLIFQKYTILYYISHTTLNICFIIIVLATILGDLTESMFKRVANIKDTGKLIPGHGGILDRIDSLSAALPIFTCIALLIKF
ncbi:MAG: CDP-diglyceride synthetase [Candidatus Westeberhardia cardiocondylae]|nr:CDP-diglyceride synthetase [Candidatus Westeberhardia cardiocondylae]